MGFLQDFFEVFLFCFCYLGFCIWEGWMQMHGFRNEYALTPWLQSLATNLLTNLTDICEFFFIRAILKRGEIELIKFIRTSITELHVFNHLNFILFEIYIYKWAWVVVKLILGTKNICQWDCVWLSFAVTNN